MKINVFTSTLFIPADIASSWSFFSDPRNLEKITPASMGFRILHDPGPSMYAGQIITYKVSPMMGIRLTWVTEISQVREGAFFIDEQRFGPYQFWHHKHFFNAVQGGVEMTDVVHYSLPLDPFSRIMLPIIRRKLGQIFRYREQAIKKIFG